MKKVVDSSVLRSAALTDFLSAPANVAVVIEDLAMEMFKGEGQTNIRHSLRILANHSRQVVVLKPTTSIIALRGRPTGLHARFVDNHQTEGFRLYCRALLSNTWTIEQAQADRARKQNVANNRYDRRKGSVETIRETIRWLQAHYSRAELKALRSKLPIEGDFWNRFADDVFDASLQFIRDHAGVRSLTGEALIYSFPFRYTLCSLARAVDWISQGGFETATPEKLMNDYTDMSYAAYATFFDGLLTEDEKLREIYTFSARLMRRAFLRVV